MVQVCASVFVCQRHEYSTTLTGTSGQRGLTPGREVWNSLIKVDDKIWTRSNQDFKDSLDVIVKHQCWSKNRIPSKNRSGEECCLVTVHMNQLNCNMTFVWLIIFLWFVWFLKRCFPIIHKCWLRLEADFGNISQKKRPIYFGNLVTTICHFWQIGVCIYACWLKHHLNTMNKCWNKTTHDMKIKCVNVLLPSTYPSSISYHHHGPHQCNLSSSTISHLNTQRGCGR